MTYHMFIELLRLSDAVMASLVVALLAFRGRLFWSEYTRAQKWTYTSYVLYVFSVAYTSFELYAQDVEVGYRSYILLVANLVALWALTRHPDKPILGERRSKSPLR